MVEDFIIAIDLGGTNLKIALLDAKYRIRDRRFLNTRRFGEKEGLIRGMAEAINDLLGCNRLSKKKIRGLGVGLPGPVDNRRGIVHFLPNIAGWKEVRLKQILEKKLGLAVFLDNDANLMSLAEYKLGAAQGSRYAVCLTLGTGVGAGIIIEGPRSATSPLMKTARAVSAEVELVLNPISATVVSRSWRAGYSAAIFLWKNWARGLKQETKKRWPSGRAWRIA